MAVFEIERQVRRKIDCLRYRLEIAMTELADELDGGVRKREKAKATPGFFYLFNGRG